MRTSRFFSHSPLLEMFLILVIAGVIYLPNLSQATIYRDDWYYTMDRLIGGPGVFQEMFRVDRPARGPFFEAYYQLFGIQPFPYHMASFLWRVAGGLAALWLFRQLWPRQRLAAFVIALLFALYPGYLRWMEGFEDQPQNVSAFLQTLSIGLTLQAIQTTRRLPKILTWTGSVLTGWAYIALVDFSLGMEAFRWLCVFLLVNRDQEKNSLLRKSITATRAWGIAALIPVGFLFWRFFLFQNERAATDVGVQLGSLLASPLLTGMWWLARLFQSTVNVLLLAWGAPFFQNLFETSLITIVIGLLIAAVAVGLFIWVSSLIWKMDSDDMHRSNPDSDEAWRTEAVWIGLIGVVAGVLPVIMANRFISFESFSHYALPASLAGVTVLVGIISFIGSRNIQLGAFAFLIFLAALTHYSASSRILREQRVIANFWHQMVWRAPGLEPGTTLIVNYPSVNFAEDVDAVAGPANFLYFPEPTNQIPVVYPLTAFPQMNYITKDVLARANRPYGYRTHVGEIRYNKLLVISQPAENACVHVMDAQWPRYSDRDSDQMLLLGQYSNIQTILPDREAPRPAEFIFGSEPAHAQEWCYYYQQAELALQKSDWDRIIQLGEQVDQLNLTPNDRIEWAPFLQAYAIKGDEKAFKTTAVKIDSSPFVRRAACLTLLKMQEMGTAFTPEVQSLMDEKLCRGQAKFDP